MTQDPFVLTGHNRAHGAHGAHGAHHERFIHSEQFSVYAYSAFLAY